jgi:hypothetical protein
MTSANRKDEEWAAALKDELEDNKRRVGPVHNRVTCQASQIFYYFEHREPVVYHGEPQCFVCAERRASGYFRGTLRALCYGYQARDIFFATAIAIQSSDYHPAQDGRRRR